MRILKVTQAYHPFLYRGGPAIKVRSIARGLVDLGHSVTVLTADLGFGADEVASAAATRDSQGWRSELDRIEAIYLTTFAHYRNLTVNPGVMRFCDTEVRDFDVVHIYGLYDTLGPIVGRYCKKVGLPYLIEPLGMTRPIDRGFLLKKLWKRLANDYLKHASKIITTSELERDELLAENFPPDRVILRYNGIDLEEFRQLPPPGTFRRKLGLSDDERVVLFLGRIIPRKGADLLIDALAKLKDKTIKLVVAGPEGEAGYINSLQAQARALQVDSQVLFIGPLYNEDKKAALRDATLFVLPSRYENFGNTAAEAIACGTPALVSDQCGIAPLIDNRAGSVTTYDAEAVVGALFQLLNDESLYRRRKAACAQVAHELSWKKLVRDMEGEYLSLTHTLQPSNAYSAIANA